MRACVGLAGIMLAASCGKQLNPEYCLGHPTDGDCFDAGLVFVDAAPPQCTDNSGCPDPMHSVCDTASGDCVACTTSDHLACSGATPECTTSHECVGCTEPSVCPSQICDVASNTCAPQGQVLYVTITGSATANCHLTATPCTLKHALEIARTDPPGDIVHMEAGDYVEGPLTLDIPHLTILIAAGQTVSIADATDGPIFTITQGPVTIEDVTFHNAKNDNALYCTNNSKLTLDHISVVTNPRDGVRSANCDITINRSTFHDNKYAAIFLDDSHVSITNNFIHHNGGTNLGAAAITLVGSSNGEVRFNTLAFNVAHSKQSQFDQDYPAGLLCANSAFSTDASSGLFADNTPKSTDTGFPNYGCGTSLTNLNWIGAASDVQFASSTDLHLTDQTPDKKFGPSNSIPAIRDNANTNSTGILQDIDGDARKIGPASDYGADEYNSGVD
jgi:hypothetical protein